MKQFTYKIKDENGIHARPAGLLVKTAGGFASEIKFTLGDKVADAKKIFSLMSLGAKCGDEISVTCMGADEAEASKTMSNFLSSNF